jgi:hypothetical protein
MWGFTQTHSTLLQSKCKTCPHALPSVWKSMVLSSRPKKRETTITLHQGLTNWSSWWLVDTSAIQYDLIKYNMQYTHSYSGPVHTHKQNKYTHIWIWVYIICIWQIYNFYNSYLKMNTINIHIYIITNTKYTTRIDVLVPRPSSSP